MRPRHDDRRARALARDGPARDRRQARASPRPVSSNLRAFRGTSTARSATCSTPRSSRCRTRSTGRRRGCLSVPGLWFPTRRSWYARVGDRLDSKPVVVEHRSHGAVPPARVDHLDGKSTSTASSARCARRRCARSASSSEVLTPRAPTGDPVAGRRCWPERRRWCMMGLGTPRMPRGTCWNEVVGEDAPRTQGGTTWLVPSPAVYFSCTQHPVPCALTSSGRRAGCSARARPSTGPTSPPRPACCRGCPAGSQARARTTSAARLNHLRYEVTEEASHGRTVRAGATRLSRHLPRRDRRARQRRGPETVRRARARRRARTAARRARLALGRPGTRSKALLLRGRRCSVRAAPHGLSASGPAVARGVGPASRGSPP